MPDNIDTYISKYKDIFNAEKELVVKINDYYKTYQNYMRTDTTNIQTRSSNKTILDTKKNELDTAITNINSKIADLRAINLTANESSKITKTSYDNNYQDILRTHARNINLRSELDEKLKTINNVKNSYSDMYANQYNATIYTGILWSILATTMIYYVFVKL